MDSWIDFHHFCNLTAKVSNTVMDEIDTGLLFIIIAPFPESGSCFITHGLFLEAGGMQRILVTRIQHDVFYDHVIGNLKHFLDDKSTNTDIDRCIEF